MKSKKRFAIAACTLMLAACSDGIAELSTPSGEILDENRPKANVVIDAKSIRGEETRFSFEKTREGYRWLFEDGDKLGALLMDFWKSGYGSWDCYELSDQIVANYPFTYNENDDLFYSPEGGTVPLSEGNYFFYYPYDNTITQRKYVGWAVNPEQKNYDPETGKYNIYQTIKENQRYLGYKFIKGMDANDPDAVCNGGEQKLEVDMFPLFATPLFEWENKTGEVLQVERLLVRSARQSASEHSQVLPTSMVLAPQTMGFGKQGSPVYTLNSSTPFDYESECKTFHNYTLYTTGNSYTKENNNKKISNKAIETACDNGSILFILSQGNISSNEAKQDIKETFSKDTYQYKVYFGSDYYGQIGNEYLTKDDNSVPEGTKIRASLVMPAGMYGLGFETELYLYSPRVRKHYMVRTYFVDKDKIAGFYPASSSDIVEGFDTGMLRTSHNNYNKFTSSFGSMALQSFDVSDFECIDNEDLMWLLKNADLATARNSFQITTTGNNVVLNDEIVAYLRSLINSYGKKTLSIDGAITVKTSDKNAVSDFIELQEGNNTTLIIDCEQEIMNNDVISPTNGTTIPTVKNMTINMGANVSANEIHVTNEFTNSGTFNASLLQTPKFTNKGTAKISSTYADIYNKGKLTVKYIYVATDANVQNFGTLSVNNSYIYIHNYGTINVEGGTLVGLQNNNITNVRGSSEIGNFMNDATANIKADLKADGINEGTMNITAGTTTPTSNGKFSNNPSGIINVANAELKYITSGATTGDLINDGIIDVNGRSHVLVAGTERSGIIDITDADASGDYKSCSNDKFSSSEFEAKMYFRAQKPVTDEFLAKVISNKNIDVNLSDGTVNKNPNSNPIILQINSDIEQHQHAVNARIAKILVTKGTLSIDGLFDQLIQTNMDSDWLGVFHKSFQIDKGATVKVLNHGTSCGCGCAGGTWSGRFETNAVSDAVVNGLLRTSSIAMVLGSVKVSGDGSVEVGDISGFTWTQGNWNGMWTSY